MAAISRDHDAPTPAAVAAQQAVRVWAAEAAATWVVRRTLEAGYHRATGDALPTARDRDIPFRRVMLWAAVTAAAVAAR